MFLSTVNGRYWVELVDQVTADWESLRMNHGIAKEFREAMRSRTVVPSVALASARFFSLRNRNADPISTAMTYKGRVQIGLGRSNRSPFPEFVQDYLEFLVGLDVVFQRRSLERSVSAHQRLGEVEV
jgi:hypothetical protein